MSLHEDLVDGGGELKQLTGGMRHGGMLPARVGRAAVDFCAHSGMLTAANRAVSNIPVQLCALH